MRIFNFKWKLKDLLLTIQEVLLLIIGGLIIFPLLSIIGVFYTLFKHLFILRDYSLSKQLNPVLRSFTLASDGLACASGGELLNDVLKVKGEIRYGKWYNTISSITGLRLKFENADTKFRKLLDKVLGMGHCESAITEQEEFYYNSKNKKL